MSPLASMPSAAAVDGAILRKIQGKDVLKTGKGINLVISD